MSGSAGGQGPLRVLVVSHEASRTGAPRVAVHLVHALRAAGCRTTLVHRWGGPLRDELDAAADDARLESLTWVRTTLRRWRRTRRLAATVERIGIRRTIRSVAPDLIWCNTVLTGQYATIAAAEGIDCIVFGHETPEYSEAGLRRAGLLGPPSPHVRFVGCASEVAAGLGRLTSGSPESVATLHSPVDVAAVRAAGRSASSATIDGPFVLAVGTGDDRKGVDVFGLAAERAAAHDLGLTWCWAGTVPPELRSPAVTYLGQLTNPAAAMAAATIVAVSSRQDQFPLVVLEAMALGRPIVASELPGIVEQVGDTALLVEPGDADALLAAVTELATDPERARGLAAAGAQRCEERWDIARFDREVAALVDQRSSSRTERGCRAGEPKRPDDAQRPSG